MAYKMTISDSVDTQEFNLLEVPILSKDIEGLSDNTTLDGNVYTDYLYLKKQWEQKFSWLFASDYARLRGFYTRQFEVGEYPYLTIVDTATLETIVPETAVRLKLDDGGIIDTCGTRQNVKLVMRETIQQ